VAAALVLGSSVPIMRPLTALLISVALVSVPYASCCAEHDLEFVAEHLPEVAMDNRYATLPVWGGSLHEAARWQVATQVAFSATEVGSLSLEGPMLSLALQRQLDDAWQLTTFGFYDELAFSAHRDFRPLQTLFAPQTPIERPVDAMFSDLDGRTTHFGAGLALRHSATSEMFGDYRWLAGIQWERVALRDYSFGYEVLAGPQTGLSGHIDFDTDYDHVTPFAGFELPRDFGRWTLAFHTLLAYPLPRRGFVGHITGPDFDISGDTAGAGNGKHFGDPSVTLGLDLTYRPAGLTVDLGTMLSQWFLEPLVHRGIDQNILLSVTWRPE
jgi:hypothetical protein